MSSVISRDYKLWLGLVQSVDGNHTSSSQFLTVWGQRCRESKPHRLLTAFVYKPVHGRVKRCGGLNLGALE